MVKLLVWGIRIAIIIALLYALFFGSLLFINPIKFGMRNKQSERAVVYTSNIYELNPVYNFVDEYMSEAETLYGLKYKKKVNIYVATSQQEFSRLVPPWIGDGVGGVTLRVGNTIYINPIKIEGNNYSEAEFLKHELVHELVFQNSSALTHFVMSSQAWMLEGMATHFGGPNYYNENEFVALMRDKKLIYNDKSGKLFDNLDPNDPKFNYTLYKFFIKYLIDKYGMGTFKTFMNQYLESPGNYKLIFFEVFDKPFQVIVEDFVKAYHSEVF